MQRTAAEYVSSLRFPAPPALNKKHMETKDTATALPALPALPALFNRATVSQSRDSPRTAPGDGERGTKQERRRPGSRPRAEVGRGPARK